MIFDSFTCNKTYSLGAELEVRFHDTQSFALKEISSEIYPLIPKKLHPFIHQEFLECMIEFVSPVSSNVTEALESIKENIDFVKKLGETNNFCLATSGSHSFKIDRLSHIPCSRYEQIAEEFGIIIDKFHICGFHLHVGFSSKESIIKGYNFILPLLPIFIALSASSGFFDGTDTRLHSYRTKLFEQLPRAGIPPYFKNYDEIHSFYKKCFENNIISSHADIWWDLRINPSFGTLEIRACDASNDFERLEVIGNFYQALCMLCEKISFEPLLHPLLKQNQWNAIRYGMEGKIFIEDKLYSIKEFYLYLLDTLKAHKIFEKLNIKDIETMYKYAHTPSLAQEQRDTFEKTNSLEAVEKLGVL